MDDRRFDALVKFLAEGANRRSVLKGILGLGGTAVVSATLLEGDVDAARRPEPTPKPVKCPQRQHWDGTTCVCDSGHTCGSDCCTGLPGDDPAPGHSECCDNACCFGTCYGEELCCPTNPRPGDLPPLAQVCEGPNGASCCGIDQACCDGVCCDTICTDGEAGADSCCDAANFCPGGGQSADLCCAGGTECCGGGTDDNSCIDLSVDGACCTVDDCSSPGEGDCGCACVGGLCLSVTCTEGETCCDGECFSDLEVVACPGGPDGCCDRETQICCGGTDCCAEDQCTSEGECCTGDDLACNTVCCPYGQCAAGVECCPGGTTPCNQFCCDDLTQTCSLQGTCECMPGTILCNEECTEGECCEGETPQTCRSMYGYDLDCVSCLEGLCDTFSRNGQLCATDDNNVLGRCAEGACIICGGAGDACESDDQCCSDTCLPEGTCVPLF